MKHCFIAIVAMLMALNAMAQGKNRIYIEDFEIEPDSTVVVPVILANSDPTRGVQFNVSPPEGLQFRGVLLNDYSSDLGYHVSVGNDNVVVVYAMSDATYKPDTIAILDAKFRARSTFKGGEVIIWRGRGSTDIGEAFPIDGDTVKVTVPTSSLIGIPVDSHPVEEQFYNMMGQPISSPEGVPVAIQVTTMNDGMRSSRKVAVLN